MYRIMIVEDNISIQRELSVFLQQSGYDTVTPRVSTRIKEELLLHNPDLILLDINLEEVDGFYLCREIRAFSDIPIIFVTCRESEEDELKGISLGGDDFIRKPYHLPVLLARIQRILERFEKTNLLHTEDVYLDVLSLMIKYKNQSMELSKNECRILYYLFIKKGKVVTKDELIESLWESKLYIDENILNVNLSRLRKRLAEIGLGNLIKTIPKEGYLV